MAYATLQDLSTYLGIADPANLPEGSARMLDRASELMDQVTLGRIDIADAALALAAKNATTAQVEYWQAVGEDVGIIGPGMGAVSIGTFKMDGATLSQLGPRATGYLKAAGLLTRAVRQAGGSNAGLAARFFQTPGTWL